LVAAGLISWLVIGNSNNKSDHAVRTTSPAATASGSPDFPTAPPTHATEQSSPPRPESTAPTTATTTVGPIAAPESIGEYRLVTGALADQIQQAIQAELTSGSVEAAILSNATIAVYTNTGSAPPLILLALPRDHVNSLPQVAGLSDTEIASSLMEGFLGKTTAAPPGPHGGALQCGDGSADTGPGCGWSDAKTIGMLVSTAPGAIAHDMADLANQVRDTIS